MSDNAAFTRASSRASSAPLATSKAPLTAVSAIVMSMGRSPGDGTAHRTRGNILLQLLAPSIAVALVLGALGPALDAGTEADYGYKPAPAEHRRLEVEALKRCADTPNTGVIHLADGTILCTDKHGRRHGERR